MKRFYKWAAVPVMLAAMAAGSMGQAPAPGTPPASAPAQTKVGVVNIVALFDALHEKTAADDSIDKMSKVLDQEYTKRQDEVNGLKNEMAHPTFAPGSPEYQKNQDDLLRKARELESFPQYRADKLSLEMRIRTASLYKKINLAVAEYAQKNGYALVFVADQVDLDKASTQDSLPQIVATRKLLYFLPGLDITNDLIRKMNVDFDLGAGNSTP